MNGFSRPASVVLIVCVVLSMAVALVSIVKQGKAQDKKAPIWKVLFSGQNVAEKPCLAVLNVYGPIEISSGRTAFGASSGAGSDGLVKRIDRLSRDKNVKGIVLRINSPGGTIASVQEIYQKLQEVRSKGLKVVASMADMAASGGYYIACACDRIVANPGTLTGSVGVIMLDLNIAGLMQKYGVRYTVIKSGSHKDIFSSFRDMTSSDRAILQSIVDDSFRQFRDVVVKNRKLGRSATELISDGRVFTGSQAKKIGLVDELGTFDDAVRSAGKLCGLGDAPAIYEDQSDPWDAFLDQLSSMFKSNPLTAAIGGPSLRYQCAP